MLYTINEKFRFCEFTLEQFVFRKKLQHFSISLKKSVWLLHSFLHSFTEQQSRFLCNSVNALLADSFCPAAWLYVLLWITPLSPSLSSSPSSPKALKVKQEDGAWESFKEIREPLTSLGRRWAVLKGGWKKSNKKWLKKILTFSQNQDSTNILLFFM